MIEYKAGDNRYCVPAAIAIIADLPVADVCKLIEHEVGDQKIEGLFYPIALKILRSLGYTYTENSYFKYVEDRDSFLLCFKGHVGVIHGGLYYDNSFPRGTTHVPKQFKLETIYKVTKND